MKTTVLARLVGALVLTGVAATASAQTADVHKIIPEKDVKWSPGPASIPPGAQVSVLYGDPAKEGMFAMRLKLPAGYHIPPHTHPGLEAVTVISGTFKLGTGTTADPGKAQVLSAGSFFAFSPGMAHFGYAEGETIVQLTSMGPWSLNYVNAKDDPRKPQ